MFDSSGRRAAKCSLLVAACVLFALVLLALAHSFLAVPDSPTARTVAQLVSVRSESLSVTELEELGDLEITRVHVVDVLTAEGEGYQGCWLIIGDALVTVAVKQVRVAAVDEELKTATLVLPSPTVSHPRVDHERTRTWDVRRNTWIRWITGDPDLLRDQAMVHAQRLIEHAARHDENLDQSRRWADLMVQQMYARLGWTVTIEWADGQRPVAERLTLPVP